MKKIKKIFNNLSKKQKNYCIIGIIVLFLSLSIGIPTLARYKNRIIKEDIAVWDGTIATSYRSGSGTESNPYIISNGSELAYFSTQLENNSYQNTYFKLNGDIILNNGSFDYNTTDGLKYILNETTYYVQNFSGSYYTDIEKTGEASGNLNIFNSLNGFKGHFDGDSYSIYGLYITDQTKDNLGLFTNLEGSVKNLYVDNSLIYGGINSGGITSNATNSTIENVIFDGLVIGENDINAISGGIVGISDNTILTNTINKGTIISSNICGGLIGKGTNEVTINHSYNTGETSSTNISGGLIGLIENNTSSINITKSYNTASITSNTSGGLIGKTDNNSEINITNSFNISETNYNIGENLNSIVNLTNGYFVSEDALISNKNISDGFISTTLANLKTKDYVITNLLFNEFINENDVKTNPNNVWIYDVSSLPILYIDDINNPIANIHVSTYKWDNFTETLNTISLNSNITFTIEPTDPLSQFSVYYYISSNKEIKNKSQLNEISNWINYTDVVTIDIEGEYIIYAKIVDSNNNITYLNTDILRLDKTSPLVSIKLDNNTWTNYRSSINNTYIGEYSEIIIEASDTLSDVDIKYYISNEIKTTEELDNVSWIKYETSIPINSVGKYIIYTKVINGNNLTTLANSDMVIFNGYTQNSLSLGRNKTSLSENPYITSNSTIYLNMTYQNTEVGLSNITHNLISNILLPQNSIITIIDKINNKVYEYKIPTNSDNYNYSSSCNEKPLHCENKATYPFTLFSEAGKLNTQYIEQDYYNNGLINENFDIILDLSKTNINTNYDNIYLNLELHDGDNKNIRPTLASSVKKFNIYSNINEESAKGNLYLNTNYNNTIIFNRDFTTDININSGINYKYIGDNIVYDSSLENKSIGLLFRMVNSSGENVGNDFYKNLKIQIGDKIYYPNNNKINIDLESGIENISKTLSIITTNNNSNLEWGTYYFKISNYVSYDGYCSNELGSTELSIPVIVEYNKINVSYNFDVKLDEISRIINKSSVNSTLSFKILQNGYFYNPNIKVSLYKKDNLDPTNQNYSIVDLQNYVTNTLNKYSDNIYYVSTSPIIYNGLDSSYNNFELNLIVSNLENTGYKYVFDLYSNEKKIGTIEKKFIVK